MNYNADIEPMTYKQQIKENELLTKLKIVRMVENQQKDKIAVARIFQCSRNTVGGICAAFKKIERNARELLLFNNNLTVAEIEELMQSMRNKPSTPYRHPRQPTEFEDYLVVWLFHERGWGVGYTGMHTKITRAFGDHASIDPSLHGLTKLTKRQIRGIYSRFELRVQKVRATSGKQVPLYNYQSLAAFEKMHYDVKVIADQKSLPREIYENLLQKDIPKYQWTLIDAKTKVRFIAYSYNTYSEFGLKFLLFCLMYIRFNFRNWDTNIEIGIDNGAEFCSSSSGKAENWNTILSTLDAKVYQYHPYFDVRKNIVERSHRTDDSDFLIPRGDVLTSAKAFMSEAEEFFFYYNFQRPHTGHSMHNRTPYEALKDTKLPNPEQLISFPVMLIEHNLKYLRQTTEFLMFQAELSSKDNPDQKTILDTSLKYSFFDESAQKVLSYYPIDL